ncbi:MAG: hypothetical protein WD270_12655 [Acetobacterales bacterium]
MARNITHAVICGAALFLGGCSFTEEALWPALTGESRESAERPQQAQAIPGAQQQAQQPAPPPAMPEPNDPPSLGSNTFSPPQISAGSSTGTFVGQKVGQMRVELRQLQQSLAQHNQRLQEVRNQTVQNSQRYHGTVAAVSARLQVGTTPGNPILVQQWNKAQQELNQISNDIAQMNTLATAVAADSTLAAYLLESVRAAYSLSGAVEEDHRQLAILEDEVNRTVVVIDRLLNELSEDIARQSQYVENERTDLTTLALAIKNGELYGQSLRNRAFTSAAALGNAANADIRSSAIGSTGPAPGQRPLVVVRFDRPNVEFKQALYTAVSRAIERRPEAAFDVVAVTPLDGSPAQVAMGSTTAKRNAEKVVRALTEMGLPAERMELSAMNSPTAQSSEVHIYVR